MKKLLYYLFVGLLFICGFTLIFNKPITNFLIETYRPTVSHQENLNVPYNWDDVKLVDLFSVIKARLHHPEIHVVGSVYNSQLNLNVPLALGVNNTILSLCAGTLEPNEQLGKNNFIVAAHNLHGNSNNLFTPLYNHAKKDDLIYVTDFKEVYIYQIKRIKTINYQNYSVLNSTKEPTLTLITCDQTNKKRVVYIGDLIKKQSFNSLSKQEQSYVLKK